MTAHRFETRNCSECLADVQPRMLLEASQSSLLVDAIDKRRRSLAEKALTRISSKALLCETALRISLQYLRGVLKFPDQIMGKRKLHTPPFRRLPTWISLPIVFPVISADWGTLKHLPLYTNFARI
ncbi:MAG: hypothetical protein OXI96_02350 [Acidimicrobiaceae bacterium]|nr:hypothetical protein [Acidimicrobiaceae bacterium]